MARGFRTRAEAFLKSDDGPTTTDYTLMLAPVILVVIVSLAALGDKMSSF